jgi:4-amino-4-deoxy-L-arabinose transferase-like glycosyltransferase
MAVTLAFLLLVPFLGKAMTIDDPLFIWVAKHIQTQPLDPYGFSANWYGTLLPMTTNVQNPPLASYWLALAGLASWNDLWLHLAMLPWAILLVVGVMRLARRLGADPFWAALLTVGTSAFLVSATTVMCDIMMLCLMTWAIVLWIDGLDRGAWGRLVIAAALGGLAALTKYFALSVIPLLAAYTLIRGLAEKRTAWSVSRLLPLLTMVALVGIWHLWSQNLYGHSHVRSAARYAGEVSSPDFERYYAAITFLGGCLVWPLVIGFWRARSLGRLLLTIAAAFGAYGLWIVMKDRDVADHLTGRAEMLAGNPLLYLLGAAFFAAGVAAIYLTLHHLWQRWREPSAWLLAIWILGAIVFLAAINWTVAARNVLPAVPPMAVLATMLSVPGNQKRGAMAATDDEQPLGWVPLAVAAVVGLAMAVTATWADSSWANGIRERTDELAARFRKDDRTVYFQGHWGFQYYMEHQGAVALDRLDPKFRRKSVVVCPYNNTNVIPLGDRPGWRIVDEVWEPLVWRPRLSDSMAGAGFHSVIFGPLPMTFSADNSDVYETFALCDSMAPQFSSPAADP